MSAGNFGRLALSDGLVQHRAWPLSFLLGCASVGSAEEELVIPERPDPPPMVVSLADDEAVPAVEPVEPAPPSCAWTRLEPQPFPALVPPPETAACRPAPSRKRRAELRRMVRDEWMFEWPDHAKLAVEHGCDRLDSELATVVLDASSGHGGSLDLVRLDHRDDGDWDVTWIDYNHYRGGSGGADGGPWSGEGPGSMVLRRGVLPRSRVDPKLRRAREALALEAEELPPPPPPPGTLHGGAGYFSSRDFHVGLRLVDRGGHGVQRYFGGYESEEPQNDRIALDLAATELWTVLLDDGSKAKLAEVPADDPAARELLAGVFWAARAREPAYGLWYVRERLFGLVTLLGDEQHVPALLEALPPQPDEGASEERSRAGAINAIAEITGFDRRYDAQGSPRAVEAVTAEVLDACGGG